METANMDQEIECGYYFTFDYVNYKGVVTKSRHVQGISMRFGSTKYHPGAQWLLRGVDVDKNQIREFAMRDMTEVRVVTKLTVSPK